MENILNLWNKSSPRTEDREVSELRMNRACTWGSEQSLGEQVVLQVGVRQSCSGAWVARTLSRGQQPKPIPEAPAMDQVGGGARALPHPCLLVRSEVAGTRRQQLFPARAPAALRCLSAFQPPCGPRTFEPLSERPSGPGERKR